MTFEYLTLKMYEKQFQHYDFLNNLKLDIWTVLTIPTQIEVPSTAA